MDILIKCNKIVYNVQINAKNVLEIKLIVLHVPVIIVKLIVHALIYIMTMKKMLIVNNAIHHVYYVYLLLNVKVVKEIIS